MRAESRYDPEALSYAGRSGLMQVDADHTDLDAEQLKEDIPPGAAFSPEANIRMGAWFLHYLLDYFGGDVEWPLPHTTAGRPVSKAGSGTHWSTNRDDLLPLDRVWADARVPGARVPDYAVLSSPVWWQRRPIVR